LAIKFGNKGFIISLQVQSGCNQGDNLSLSVHTNFRIHRCDFKRRLEVSSTSLSVRFVRACI